MKNKRGIILLSAVSLAVIVAIILTVVLLPGAATPAGPVAGATSAGTSAAGRTELPSATTAAESRTEDDTTASAGVGTITRTSGSTRTSTAAGRPTGTGSGSLKPTGSKTSAKPTSTTSAGPTEGGVRNDLIQEGAYDMTVELGGGNHNRLDGFGAQVNTEYFMDFNTGFGVGEADYQVFAERVKEMKIHKFRIAVLPDYFEPANDDNDPNHFNWAGFQADSAYMKALYRILDVAQANRVKVNITMFGVRKGTWLAFPEVEEGAWWNTAPRDVEEYAETSAALLQHLIVNKGYTCIYQFTPYNEPDFGFVKGTKEDRNKVDFDYYVRTCAAIDSKLKATGLRDRIDFNLADDATYPAWLEKVTRNSVLKQIGDSFNSHSYTFDSSSNDNALFKNFSQLTGLTRSNAFDKPFQVNEFGSGQTVDWPITTAHDLDTYGRGLMYARAAVNLLNAGGVGYTHWTLFDYMREDQRMMKTGMYGFHTEKWKARPMYYAFSLMTRYCVPGSEVYPGIEKDLYGRVIDAEQKDNGISAAFLKTDDGRWTQLLTNDNDVTVKVKINASVLGNTAFKRFLYREATLPGDSHLIRQDGTVTFENGALVAAIPARSFLMLTNVD